LWKSLEGKKGRNQPRSATVRDVAFTLASSPGDVGQWRKKKEKSRRPTRPGSGKGFFFFLSGDGTAREREKKKGGNSHSQLSKGKKEKNKKGTARGGCFYFYPSYLTGTYSLKGHRKKEKKRKRKRGKRKKDRTAATLWFSPSLYYDFHEAGPGRGGKKKKKKNRQRTSRTKKGGRGRLAHGRR